MGYELPPSPWPQWSYLPQRDRSLSNLGGAPQFSAPLWVIEEAYARVMHGVSADADPVKMLLRPVTQAFWAGNMRTAIPAARSVLGLNFEWPEYDSWDEEFMREGRAPDWWPRHYLPAPVETLADVVAIARMVDLRAIAKSLDIPKGEIPRTKDELAALVMAKGEVEMAKPHVSGIIADRAARGCRDQAQARLELLIQTIFAAVYNLLRWYKGQELIMDGVLSGWAWRWESLAIVEDTWARRLYTPEQGIIPPFFPGDRTRHSYTRL